MPSDDKAAQKARAQRLRRQIDKIISARKGEEEKPQQLPESPREFIHRKMREKQQEQTSEDEEDTPVEF